MQVGVWLQCVKTVGESCGVKEAGKEGGIWQRSELPLLPPL